MRDTIEEINERIRSMMPLLEAGHPVKVGDIYIRVKDNNTFRVGGVYRYAELALITKQDALEELEWIKETYNQFLTHSDLLQQLSENKKNRIFPQL